jgi:hypothetical protein
MPAGGCDRFGRKRTGSAALLRSDGHSSCRIGKSKGPRIAVLAADGFEKGELTVPVAA